MKAAVKLNLEVHQIISLPGTICTMYLHTLFSFNLKAGILKPYACNFAISIS